MGGVWYRFRAEARRRAVASLLLGVFVGLGAGSPIAAVVVTPIDPCPVDRCDQCPPLPLAEDR